MKSILVQSGDLKFIQNLCETNIENTKIYQNTFDNKLYGLYFLNKPSHIVFIAEKIDRECLQFIRDYGEQTRVFIYHQNLKERVDFSIYPNFCSHMVHDTEQRVLSVDNLIVIPNNLLNDQIYFPQNKNRDSKIVYFFPRNTQRVPDYLQSLLYPNSKLPILTFHSIHAPNYQNMGIVTEKDRGDILRSNEYYLTFDNDQYIEEAIACGSKIITPPEAKNYIEEAKIIEPRPNIKYSNFIAQEILNDK